MYKKSIFIITYGRSGSTLLQGILNSIDGYEIKGENYSALGALFYSYIRIKKARYKQGKNIRYSTDPWFGSDELSPKRYGQNLVKVFIEDILQPSHNSKVIGFKEIRYDVSEFSNDQYVIEYLYFLKEFFPNARFIFNERNIEDTSESAWWKEDPKASQKIQAIIARMKVLYYEFQDISCWVNYDKYSKNIEELQPLFGFLEEEFDKERLENILKKKHSY